MSRPRGADVRLLACGLLALATAARAADVSGTLDFAGRTRTYLAHVPRALPADGAPLVLVLHGGKIGAIGGTAQGMAWLTDDQWTRAADQGGLLVVYPQGVDGWADGRGVTGADAAGVDDVGFLLALRAALRTQYRTGPTYVTGISNGGFMAHRLACDAPAGTLQGVGAVAATFVADRPCEQAAPIPYVLLVGASDPLIRYYGGANQGRYVSAAEEIAAWAARNQCSAFLGVSAAVVDNAADGMFAVRWAYRWCSAPTVFYAVTGMGHTWPDGRQYLPVGLVGPVTRDVSGADAMLSVWR